MALKTKNRLFNSIPYFKTIAGKINLLYSLLLFVSIFGILITVNRHVTFQIIKNLENSLINQARIIDIALDGRYAQLSSIELQTILANVAEDNEIRITIIDKNGTVVFDSEIDLYNNPDILDNHFDRPEIVDARVKGLGFSVRYSDSVEQNMLYAGLKSNHDSYYIRTSKPLILIKEITMGISGYVISAGIIAIVLSLIISFLLSKTISAPIQEAVIFAEIISEGNYEQKLSIKSNSEMNLLQSSLNKMAESMKNHINLLTTEQAKLSSIIESIQDAIMVIDNTGEILISNKSLQSLYNLDSKPEGRQFYNVIRGSDFNSRIRKAIEKKFFNAEAFEIRLQNGEICETSMQTVSDNGRVIGLLIVLHKITEKKEMEKIKTDLVGNLSHELKTPITIIKGYLETVLLNYNDKEMSTSFIKKSLINLERQNSIINDMLKLNMIETGDCFPKETFDIIETIITTLTLLRPKIDKLQLSVHINNVLPEHINSFNKVYISANRFLTEQIFFNLIDNAINYNKPEGFINIAVNIDKTDMIYVEVSDSGIGIPDESHSRIFERFYRVDKGRSRSSGGTGLGLAIVKHSVEIQGWSISVKPNVKISETGTTFEINIPTSN